MAAKEEINNHHLLITPSIASFVIYLVILQGFVAHSHIITFRLESTLLANYSTNRNPGLLTLVQHIIVHHMLED